MDLLQRADHRRQAAEAILRDLDLMEQWRRFGRPVLVGALAFDLAVAPDIDLEVYCPKLRIEHGFQVLAQCALHPRITGAQFHNGLATPDKALYWQLRYHDAESVEWKIDMWSAPEDYALPRGEHFVGPMREALCTETRRAILGLKESRAEGHLPNFLSIDLYRAVLDGGARTAEQFRLWLETNPTGELTGWKPRKSTC